MEIITMESTAYKELIGRIEEIASHVRKQHPVPHPDESVSLLDNGQVMRLLGVSRRTLQRLRNEKRIRYTIVRGHCRYPLGEVERILRENGINASAEKPEELRYNYRLRTGRKRSGM